MHFRQWRPGGAKSACAVSQRLRLSWHDDDITRNRRFKILLLADLWPNRVHIVSQASQETTGWIQNFHHCLHFTIHLKVFTNAFLSLLCLYHCTRGYQGLTTTTTQRNTQPSRQLLMYTSTACKGPKQHSMQSRCKLESNRNDGCITPYIQQHSAGSLHQTSTNLLTTS